jgi:2-keto-4-pentenoate hydratase/2-oxohepta-3-ene-1,7-dioic acid hydratase in catechol pathway
MKIARLNHGGQPRWAELSEQGESYRLFLSAEPWNDSTLDNEKQAFNIDDLLAPALPGKIVAVGLNYREHIREMESKGTQDPVLFLKPPTALLHPGGVILYPPSSKQVDYEAELAVVLKKRLKNASPEEARKAVWGYTCCNDVTARDLQKTDGQWTRAKGFDTFCPLGPWLVTDLVEAEQKITCRLNGEVKQESRISERIWNSAELLSFASKVMTLEPLDVLTTGTPSGIGPMKPGDTVEVEVEGIGILQNVVSKG